MRSGVFEGGPHHVAQFGVLGGAGGGGGLVEFHLGAVRTCSCSGVRWAQKLVTT